METAGETAFQKNWNSPWTKLPVIKFKFYLLEVVSRYRDPQLQVVKNYLPHLNQNYQIYCQLPSSHFLVWERNKKTKSGDGRD